MKPTAQPPHSFPVRLLLHKGSGLASNARGGGKRQAELPPHPQYPGGQRIAAVSGPLALELENMTYKLLVTFTKVVHAAMPKGQLPLVDTDMHWSTDDDFEIASREAM